MDKEKEIQNKKNEIMKIFWLFIIGSIIGCIVEMIVCFVQKGYIEPRKGLIYGPFIPVYGIGAIVYYCIISKVQNTKKVFFISMFVGGITEYLCSYLQEVFFGTVSWNYSSLWFNINGRTSLLHCIYWGIAGILFIKLIYPFIQKTGQYVKNKFFSYITVALLSFMIFNISISCMAAARQKERILHKPADSSMDVLLDTYYPDQKMDYIYSNKMIKSSLPLENQSKEV